MENDTHSPGNIPFDIWRTSGATEHLGGVFATRRLLELCRLTPNQRVLDLGCGTGFTACTLARKYSARVVAIDVSPTSIQQARRRAAREQVGERVTLLQADAHHLPCAAQSFDAVIVESVLVFCRAGPVTAEAYRVLKSDGLFAANEFALVDTPPGALQALLSETLGIQTFPQRSWQRLFQQAGFTEIASIARRLSFFEQLASHLRVDGLAGYFAALVKGLADKRIRRVFINKEMLRAARQFSRLVGYHIYLGRKSPASKD